MCPTPGRLQTGWRRQNTPRLGAPFCVRTPRMLRVCGSVAGTRGGREGARGASWPPHAGWLVRRGRAGEGHGGAMGPGERGLTKAVGCGEVGDGRFVRALSGAARVLVFCGGGRAPSHPQASSPDLLSRLRHLRAVLLAAHQNALTMAVATPPAPVLPLPLPRYVASIDAPQSVHASWQLSSAVVQEPPAQMRASATYRGRVPGRGI